jgi:hypothetical protein
MPFLGHWTRAIRQDISMWDGKEFPAMGRSDSRGRLIVF